MKIKVKMLVFFVGFWLLFALVPSYVPLVQASDAPASEASSPEWVWRWDNPWTLTAYRDGVANSAFFATPQVFWNGTHWVDYVYEEHEDYYLLRNSHIAVDVYDYYAKFYDVNYSEVRLYDERWEVQRWRPKQGRWDDIGAQSGTPAFIAITNESGVWLTKSFTSWAGVLNITYTLRVANPLKHTVTWKSFIAEETEFRIVQAWSGIVGGKVKHAQGKENVTASIAVNSTWFRFMKLDGTFAIFQNLWDTGFLDERGHYRNYVLQPTTIDVHAQGMKADFIFQNSTIYTIPKDGTIKLDPTTSTFPSEADKDGNIVRESRTYPPGPEDTRGVYTEFDLIWVGQEYDDHELAYLIYRGYFSFKTSKIPNNASILSAKLRLATRGNCSYQDFYVEVWGGGQPIYGDDGLNATDWGSGETLITTWNTADYPGDNEYINLTISTNQINKWGRTQFELKSSREGTAPTGCEYVLFHSAESSGYTPILEVTWHLQTVTINGTNWYYLNASNDRAAIVLFGGWLRTSGGKPIVDWVKINSLYNDTFPPLGEWWWGTGDEKDKFIEDLHASGFDILTLETDDKHYSGSETWVYNATTWLEGQDYQDISLFGFSGGGVVIAKEIQRDYANIWHRAVVASAPVNWSDLYDIYKSAQTAHEAKVPTSFIAPVEDWTYGQMRVYYNNMVVHKEWHNWSDGHDPFPNTCLDHSADYPSNETVAEATTNWYHTYRLDVYVYNTAGSPLYYALVRVVDYPSENEKWRRRTDSQGHAYGYLRFGSYKIYVSKSGYYSQSRGIYIDSDRVEKFYLQKKPPPTC